MDNQEYVIKGNIPGMIDILEKDLNRYRNSLNDLQNEKLQYLIVHMKHNYQIIRGRRRLM